MEDLSKYTFGLMWAVRKHNGEVVKAVCTGGSYVQIWFRDDQDIIAASYNDSADNWSYGTPIMPWAEWEKRLPDVEVYMGVLDGQFTVPVHSLQHAKKFLPQATGLLKITIKDGKPSIEEVKDA